MIHYWNKRCINYYNKNWFTLKKKLSSCLVSHLNNRSLTLYDTLFVGQFSHSGFKRTAVRYSKMQSICSSANEFYVVDALLVFFFSFSFDATNPASFPERISFPRRRSFTFSIPWLLRTTRRRSGSFVT